MANRCRYQVNIKMLLDFKDKNKNNAHEITKKNSNLYNYDVGDST